MKDLEERYKQCLLDELDQALFNTTNEKQIFQLINTLLTRLVNEGYNVETLFAHVTKIFISPPAGVHRPFRQKFTFYRNILSETGHSYRVFLRIEGRLDDIYFSYREGDLYLTRQIDNPPTVQDRNSTNVNFFEENSNKLFAVVELAAKDDRVAGLLAKDRLALHLNLIRFTSEHAMRLYDDFIAMRLIDSTARHYITQVATLSRV